VIRALLIAAIAFAVLVPLVLALSGRRAPLWLTCALAPGVAFAVAGAISAATAWGGRTADGSDDVTNTGSLLVAAALALMAGGMAAALSWLIARVRRGNAWTRGAGSGRA
jgi:hypothetical protein